VEDPNTKKGVGSPTTNPTRNKQCRNTDKG
jgi:hypothetical protein